MNIKQIVNLASFYAKNVKNSAFETNRTKQGIKSANQNSLRPLKNNQKAEFSAESQTQRGLDGLRGLRGFGGLRNVRGLRGARLAEYGRSMVEMLGVLAVIGVLSVAGMMGYRYAMDKYRANDIIYEVNLRNRDTWHKYQLKGLPENEDMLNEWAEYTSTGFPIGVYLRSTDMFDVQVDDVPSRVCLNVLNTNLEGPLLIWVPTGENGRQLYDGTNAKELCQYGEEDAENVSIVFTTSLSQYGAELGGGEAVDENGRPVRYCLDDGDCTGTCERCGSDYKCESTCPDATPICSATQGKCVRCEVNDDCPINQICNEATNECDEIPEACAEDEFRSRNGACIPCSHPSNVIISADETFGEDKATGAELCANCANEGTARKLETAGSTTYCSYTCTKGISVQGKDGQCHPCVNPDGTPNTEVIEINGGTESKSQCLACGNREWVQGKTGNGFWCFTTLNCPDGYFIGTEYSAHIGASGRVPECISCSDFNLRGYMGYHSFSGPTSQQTLTDTCNSCGNRYENNNFCFPKCEQPDENSEESTICLTDPSNEKCKRKWQNYKGECFDCNAVTDTNRSLLVYDNKLSPLDELCQKCGRQVAGSGYCAPKQNTCGVGKIMDVSGNCVACDSATVATIISDEVSGCTACNTDGKELRWVVSFPSTSGTTLKCMKKCGEEQWQRASGVCMNCSDNFYYPEVGMSPELQNLCTACSVPNERVLVQSNTFCAKESCEKNEFHNYIGECISCDIEKGTTVSNLSPTLQQECEACGNRILLGYMCVLINPGVSGVCNSIGNGSHENYPDGDGKLFRDYNGNCRDCNTLGSVMMGNGGTIEQCKSCGNRRWDGGCALGLCTDGTTFLNVNNQCISCTTSSKTEIDNITTSRSSCTECDNKRVMTAEDTSGATKAYCVNDCFGQLQNVNGQCGGSSWGVFEIGSDDTSKSMCRNYERIVYSKVNGDQTRWYCSAEPRDGYFININGGLSSCTSGSTEIPDSNDARNLCLDCSGAKHTVVEKDGRFYCEKG